MEKLLTLSKSVIDGYRERGLCISTMESCTGGMLAGYLTCIPGSSDVVKIGFVTYSTDAKVRLGVSADIIDMYTVYSPQTALEMAYVAAGQHNALFPSDAVIGIGVTGSFSRHDPSNAGSKPGEVHIGYFGNGIHLVEGETIHVPPNGARFPRLEDKHATIEHVLTRLQHALE